VREVIYVRRAAGTAALQFSRPYRIAEQLRKPAGGTGAAVSQNLAPTVQRQQKNRETGFGPRLPVQSESTIKSANVR
jgi:hypothetical protein